MSQWTPVSPKIKKIKACLQCHCQYLTKHVNLEKDNLCHKLAVRSLAVASQPRQS